MTWVPYLAPVAAAVSAVIAMFSFLRTQKVRREDIAREAEVRKETARRDAEVRHEEAVRDRMKEARAAWSQYLTLAFNNPQFSSGFEIDTADRDSREQYEWFVTSMLFSGEGILDAQPNDPYWRAALKTQFSLHRTYLTSSSFEEYLEGYSPRIQGLLVEWKAELEEPPAAKAAQEADQHRGSAS